MFAFYQGKNELLFVLNKNAIVYCSNSSPKIDEGINSTIYDPGELIINGNNDEIYIDYDFPYCTSQTYKFCHISYRDGESGIKILTSDCEFVVFETTLATNYRIKLVDLNDFSLFSLETDFSLSLVHHFYLKYDSDNYDYFFFQTHFGNYVWLTVINQVPVFCRHNIVMTEKEVEKIKTCQPYSIISSEPELFSFLEPWICVKPLVKIIFQYVNFQ